MVKLSWEMMSKVMVDVNDDDVKWETFAVHCHVIHWWKDDQEEQVQDYFLMQKMSLLKKLFTIKSNLFVPSNNQEKVHWFSNKHQIHFFPSSPLSLFVCVCNSSSNHDWRDYHERLKSECFLFSSFPWWTRKKIQSY